MKNIRLLIADDNPQNLQFLSNYLSDDFCIVATVNDGKALIAAAVALDPSYYHHRLADEDGSLAIRQLEALIPDIKIIVLTDQEDPEFGGSDNWSRRLRSSHQGGAGPLRQDQGNRPRSPYLAF